MWNTEYKTTIIQLSITLWSLREFSIDSLYSWVWVTLSCFFACLVSFLLETWHFRYYIVATLDSVGLLLLFLGGVCLVVCLDKFCEVHCPTHFPSSPPQCTTIDVSAQFEFEILVMFKLRWPEFTWFSTAWWSVNAWSCQTNTLSQWGFHPLLMYLCGLKDALSLSTKIWLLMKVKFTMLFNICLKINQ